MVLSGYATLATFQYPFKKITMIEWEVKDTKKVTGIQALLLSQK